MELFRTVKRYKRKLERKYSKQKRTQLNFTCDEANIVEIGDCVGGTKVCESDDKSSVLYNLSYALGTTMEVSLISFLVATLTGCVFAECPVPL